MLLNAWKVPEEAQELRRVESYACKDGADFVSQLRCRPWLILAFYAMVCWTFGFIIHITQSSAS